MALLHRFTRLLRADVHAVLDRLEEPETLLRQALREMEEEVTRAASELKAGEAQRTSLQARRDEAGGTLARLASELDLAFGAGNDTLARGVLRRRIESERLAQHLDQRLAATAQELALRQRGLDEQRETLDALRQKAAMFETDGATSASSMSGEAITDADVELAWLRERQQRGAP